MTPRWSPEHAPIYVDDLPRPAGARPQLLDDVGIAARGDEADILAVRLFGDCKPKACRKLPGLGLRTVAKREAKHGELRGRRGIEEIALVAAFVRGLVERAPAVRKRA